MSRMVLALFEAFRGVEVRLDRVAGALILWVVGALLAHWLARAAASAVGRGTNMARVTRIVRSATFYALLAALLLIALQIAGVPVNLGGIWSAEIAGIGGGVTVRNIAIALLLVLIGLIVSRLVARLVGRELVGKGVDATAADAAQKVVFWSLLLAVAATALQAVNISIASFAFLGGAVAIGVGFGAQNIINNFISGWILLAERPIRLNDLVEVEGHTGRVTHLGARCTRIRRGDGVDILVPNSKLLENTVVNWTLIDDTARSCIRLGVAYGSPTEKVAELIRRAVDEQEEVLRDPPPQVAFEDFGDNALIFAAYYWTAANGPAGAREVASDIRHRIDALCREESIPMPFPQRDVHLDTLKPLEVRVVQVSEGTKG